MANMYDWQGKGTGFWSRVNCLNSPWFQEDVSELVLKAGHQLDVIMLPKVEGPWDIHFADQYVAQLEAKAGLTRPILFHAILETAEGMARVEEIALASPRMQGISLGPADLAANRKMKTTRVGGGHPFYRVIDDPTEDGSPRASAQQDPWHYTIARMVDACRMAGINAFYGPFGDIADLDACEQQFRNAFLLGCAGTWSLHPSQIAIAKRVFSPDPGEVKFARKILAAMPDGTGVAMIDGKMQDDATWKQAKVISDLADLVASKDPDLAAAYEA
jgi:malyl-CoA/(S)-citramalyl-CoA lyase